MRERLARSCRRRLPEALGGPAVLAGGEGVAAGVDKACVLGADRLPAAAGAATRAVDWAGAEAGEPWEAEELAARAAWAAPAAPAPAARREPDCPGPAAESRRRDRPWAAAFLEAPREREAVALVGEPELHRAAAASVRRSTRPGIDVAEVRAGWAEGCRRPSPGCAGSRRERFRGSPGSRTRRRKLPPVKSPRERAAGPGRSRCRRSRSVRSRSPAAGPAPAHS